MNDFVIGTLALASHHVTGLHCTRDGCHWMVELSGGDGYAEVSLNEVRELAAQHRVREHGYG